MTQYYSTVDFICFHNSLDVYSSFDKNIVNVEGTGKSAGINYSFIPDVENIIQGEIICDFDNAPTTVQPGIHWPRERARFEPE